MIRNKMKYRKLKDLRMLNLVDEFRWIDSINLRTGILPSAEQTYDICFHPPKDFKLQKNLLEKFIFKYFEVGKGIHQVIFCWRETGMVLVVF